MLLNYSNIGIISIEQAEPGESCYEVFKIV